MPVPSASSALLEAVDDECTVAWFCVRTQLKHEHIAAGRLRQFGDVEVFNPRIRFKRATKNGPALVTESLFPGYLFARFDWRTHLTKVHYSPGVNEVVHFGTRWPTIPDPVIQDLQRALGQKELHVVPSHLAPGDTVKICGGALHGMEAVISKVLSGQERVLLLMDFLGRQSTVELEAGCVIKQGPV